MSIEEVLKHLETTLIEDINGLSKKDRCQFWAGVKEYQQAKMQRTTAAPLGDLDNNFTVQIIKKTDEIKGAL